MDRDFDLCINVNLKALFLATSVLLPTMIKQGRGGCFVQIASVAASRPAAGLTWYCAAKAAVLAVSRPAGLVGVALTDSESIILGLQVIGS